MRTMSAAALLAGIIAATAAAAQGPQSIPQTPGAMLSSENAQFLLYGASVLGHAIRCNLQPTERTLTVGANLILLTEAMAKKDPKMKSVVTDMMSLAIDSGRDCPADLETGLNELERKLRNAMGHFYQEHP